LVGFGLVCILSNLVAHYSGELEAMLVRNKDEFRLKWILKPWMLDDKNRELSKRAKVYFSVVVIVLLIAMGTLIAHFTEKLLWIERFYLPICSITTVGYGDYSFQTVAGKLWGGVSILISSVIVARAFTFVSEYDFQRRSDGDILNEITKE
jgi:potassium channel subfamily K